MWVCIEGLWWSVSACSRCWMSPRRYTGRRVKLIREVLQVHTNKCSASLNDISIVLYCSKESGSLSNKPMQALHMSRMHSRLLCISTQGIRVIKAYAWERATATMIQVAHVQTHFLSYGSASHPQQDFPLSTITTTPRRCGSRSSRSWPLFWYAQNR